MKKVHVLFADRDYDYFTTVNPEVSNESINFYFKDNLFNGQQCIGVEFEYRVVSGSFVGEVGRLNPFKKWAFLPLLTVASGNKLAVTMDQLEQIL